MTASTPLLATFAAYLLLMVGIGFWAWRSTRSFDDYILGGRSLGSYVTALSAGPSDMSGWQLLGLPGALYLGGVSEAWIAIGLLLGAWANWKFVAGPLRVYTEHASNALTLPDYFTNRFADEQKVLRVIAALVILLFFAVYCDSGMVAGILLSAILAAIMSTLSCQLLVCSSALTEDLYRGFLRPLASQRELVWFGRAMVLAVALLAIWIARDPDSRVLGLVSDAWAGFGSAFGPVVLVSLVWSRMTRNGALAGILTGAIVVIAWKEVAVGQFGSGLYEMVPGFFCALAAILVVSLLGRAPPGHVQRTHDAVHAELAAGY